MYLSEYNRRSRLRKIGFFDSAENLDSLSADAFCVISAEIDKIQDEDMKRSRKK